MGTLLKDPIKDTSMKQSEAQYQSKLKYRKNHTKIYSLEVNRTTESDVYDALESQKNKSGYIKDLIRKDIQG